MDKPFSIRIGSNLLLIKPLDNVPGKTHRLVINGESHLCNFAFKEQNREITEIIKEEDASRCKPNK